MENDLLGNAWLRDRFGLAITPLRKECRLGSRPKVVPGDGVEWEYFPKSYAPEPHPLAHVEFALKYDHLHLQLLRGVFMRLSQEEVATWVGRQPTGKWARRVGYLYEFLTGRDLDPKALGVGGNYAPLLDKSRYVAAARPVKIQAWRIEDNLLGGRNFCPVVRITPGVQESMKLDVTGRLDELSTRYPPEIFRRAVGYLYQKETRSSYDIEREEPTPAREARFVAALHDAGKVAQDETLRVERLVGLQNIIVDPRYAQSAYRGDQNYVGETLPNHRQRIHFVPPPPQFVYSLMDGLGVFLEKSTGSPPLTRAAIAAFGFVFVHPFEDGNGRLHRFLIHDVLALDGYVPAGVILPVSAWMLKNLAGYDQCLESYSRPLMELLRYDLDQDDRLTVLNPDEVEAIYRYPDMTTQVEYLATAVEGALSQELEPELNFLSGYDAAKRDMRAVVDMPDRKMDTLIKLLHQNRGVLSKNKRELFRELTELELEKLSAIFRAYFRMGEDREGPPLAP
jgi:hypothetical protein